MHISILMKNGRLPTLFCAFLHFDLNFIVFVILGRAALFLARGFVLSHHPLTASAIGLLLAMPLLSAAFFRIIFVSLSDRIGSKLAGMLLLWLMCIPIIWAWLSAYTYNALLGAGFVLGMAGASFAIDIPMVSRWRPPQLRGLVMGIAVDMISSRFMAEMRALIALGTLEMGNRAVFQIIPQLFGKNIGKLVGLAGASGGIGGYYLNVSLGYLRDVTGTYASGLWVFGVTALLACIIHEFFREQVLALTWNWLRAGGLALKTVDHSAITRRDIPLSAAAAMKE